MQKWKALWPNWRRDFLQIEKTSSLALFAYWQGVTYPSFSSEVQFVAEDLFHPLIDRKARVPNDVAFQPPLKMVLLSGSNMAGKSTFLRTLALNQILATAGLPVFATKLTTFHGPVLSCIQISDSLRDGFSYFMSEVLRLSEVLKKAANEDQPALVVIDEIFRGTNNRERHLGSQSVIQKLTSTPSLSVVSTHDLELTHLAEGNSKVANFHFREDYEGDKMTFHYKLHPGPPLTTNALKIMAQHGLYD
jgi:DNA mismatch repair ATPase MutS